MTAIEVWAEPVDPGPSEAERIRRLYLLSKRHPPTRALYAHDLSLWWAWCQSWQVDPLAAGQEHLDGYLAAHARAEPAAAGTAVLLAATVPALTWGRRYAPASLTRLVSTVSGFYKRAVREGVIVSNPAEWVDRPQVKDRPRPYLSAEEAHRLAARRPPCRRPGGGADRAADHRRAAGRRAVRRRCRAPAH